MQNFSAEMANQGACKTSCVCMCVDVTQPAWEVAPAMLYGGDYGCHIVI